MSDESSFQRVAENLYRGPSQKIYALLKVHGKQFKRSMKTKVLAEAKRKLAEYRKEVETTNPESSRMTVTEACDKYLATIQDQAASTVEGKTIILDKVKARWANLPLRDLKKSDVLEWLASLGSSVSWTNQHLRALRAVLVLAVDDGAIYRSPLEGTKEKKVPTPIRDTPSPEEFKAIVASIRTQCLSDTAHESADFVQFMGQAGLGLAEASSLTWGDVNFEGAQLISFRHKTTSGFAIPLYPQVRPLLEKRYASAVAANGGNPPSPNAKVFSVADAKKALAGACKRLGYKNFSSRSLRRRFITDAILRGVDIPSIARWQGHKDGGKLLLSTYAHVLNSHSDTMALRMTDAKPDNVVSMVAA